MCRMVIFSGYCVRCGVAYQVPELTQSVSCLEAKNNGAFGDCKRGVHYDQHDPGMECSPCSNAMGLVDGNGDDLVAATSAASSAAGAASHGHHSSYDTSKRRRVR